MSLLLLLGGARSGKSSCALALAGSQQQPVVFVATAQALDPDMAERIGRHRGERPAGWTTVEEPLELAAALAAAPPAACAIVDCLTLWVSNLLGAGTAPVEIERLGAEAAGLAAARPGPTIAVSNEVGLGIVPATELGREYRDLLGRVNTAWAAAAAESYLLAAGRALPLGPAPVSLRARA